jgi:hypothetical protein
VYAEFFDTRERYTYFRFVGEGALPLLGAEASFPDIVNWMAEDSSEDGWMIEVLASAVLKRRPQDLQPGVDALMSRLRGGVHPASNDGAWRAAALFRLLGRAIERAAKDDLRPPGNRPVGRLEPTAAELAWAIGHVESHRVEGLAYYGCTASTVRWLAHDHMFASGSPTRAAALIAIDDLGPLWGALDDVIMDERVEVPSRNYLLKTCWESLEAVRNLGARPGNEHVLFLPEQEWTTLHGRLDRVNRLAASTERLLRACEGDPLTLNQVLTDEYMNIQRLVNDGARIAPAALSRLEARLEELAGKTEPNINVVAYKSLYPVVKRGQQATACDREPAVVAEALGI